MKERISYSALGTVVYGLIVIVPIGVVFLLLVKLTEILEKIAAPLGLESNFGAAIALVIAIVVAILFVLLLSWFVGTVMRRFISYQKFETTFLNQVPGYQIVASIAKGFVKGEASYPPALIEIHGPGTGVMGFVMEEHANDLFTVYIPSVPVPTVGNVYIVKRERLTLLEARGTDITDCISQWGIGSKKIVAATKEQR
jgi:uncharacterized membrane protein